MVGLGKLRSPYKLSISTESTTTQFSTSSLLNLIKKSNALLAPEEENTGLKRNKAQRNQKCISSMIRNKDSGFSAVTRKSTKLLISI